jgi:hypothetical protein
VIQRARGQTVCDPVWQDWLWYAVLPPASYALLAAGAACLPWNAEGPLFVIAAAALGLLLIGIHNAWGTVTYLASSQEAA